MNRSFLFLWLALTTCQTAWAEKPETTFKKQVLNDRFFTEGASIGDFNHDGRVDISAGPFWFEGPEFNQEHAFYTPMPFDPMGYSDNFHSYGHDVNGDQWDDIVVIGFPGAASYWYENPKGKEEKWLQHLIFAVVDNESPTFRDITGDGKPEIVCSTDGYFGYATPDSSDVTKPWVFHRISDQTAGARFTHGLGIGDVNGDGRIDLLEKSGWWEQPASLDGDPVWKKHVFPFSDAGGAHMYAEDVNGDGRNDVITSLEAHGYGLVWWEQLAGESGEVSFKKNLIVGAKPNDSPCGVAFSQLHAIELADMNGDGQKDIITGKRWWAHGPNGDAEPNAAAVLYWFERLTKSDGSVDWKAHLIDDDSGIGTQFTVGDVNGDSKLDVVVGNKKGIFVHRQP